MIGVVGPSDETSRLVESIEGVEVDAGEPETVLATDPAFVVAIGEPAVVALVRAEASVPILPVDTGAGLVDVAPDRAPTVIDRALDAGFDVREWPLLEVAIDGEPICRGVFDVMLVTTEPARISEYTVETPESADRFRADGVVIATPAGSRGYARAVGGPVLDSDADGLAVVPVAAFDVRSTARVARGDATLSVRVERDEGGISLLVDGEECGQVSTKRPVTISTVDVLETVLPNAA